MKENFLCAKYSYKDDMAVTVLKKLPDVSNYPSKKSLNCRNSLQKKKNLKL